LDSTRKYGTASGSIFCDSVSPLQLLSLGKEGYGNRTWFHLLKIEINSSLPREMIGERDTLHLTMNPSDLIEIIDLVQKYSKRQIHCFSAFNVPRKISKKRESTLDLNFFYNLQGLD
jgi:hypothetical protein